MALLTHLIKLNGNFGVMTDDYDSFFDARCEAISRELVSESSLRKSIRSGLLRVPKKQS